MQASWRGAMNLAACVMETFRWWIQVAVPEIALRFGPCYSHRTPPKELQFELLGVTLEFPWTTHPWTSCSCFISTEKVSTFLDHADAPAHTVVLFFQLCLMKHVDFFLFGSRMCVMWPYYCILLNPFSLCLRFSAIARHKWMWDGDS